MMTDLHHGWKILTHDWRSPLQGGPPVCDGRWPVTLPAITLDTGPEECAAGWNYVADIPTGWRIAGCWPTGRPARIVLVEGSADAIQRGTKRRASSLTLVREATDSERRAAWQDFSAPFGVHAGRLAREQEAWWYALARPHHNRADVEAHLTFALSARALPWELRFYEDAGAVWDAWAAWAAWDAWAARDARDARAAWDAWDAWDARDARDALIICCARLMGWQAGEPYQYTVGIREAYHHGLAVALPVGPSTLGWAMEEAG